MAQGFTWNVDRNHARILFDALLAYEERFEVPKWRRPFIDHLKADYLRFYLAYPWRDAYGNAVIPTQLALFPYPSAEEGLGEPGGD